MRCLFAGLCRRAGSPGRRRRRGRATTTALVAVLLIMCGTAAGGAEPRAAGASAEPSDWIGTAAIDPAERYGTAADGDLWPSCWADDDHLYSAWGDGRGFDLEADFVDIGVARISGPAESLTGDNLAVADEVGQVWTAGGYSRKPTGMVCVGDTLYLAVQDLSHDFDDAPAATIARSDDGGETWTWDTAAPMFDDHVFTTIWFADFGRGGTWAPDGYVYAYGLDGNWRDSYRDAVPDPTDLFLARVPNDRVQDIDAWEFFAGTSDEPAWSADPADRRPVLTDERRVYRRMFDPELRGGLSVLSQGHVLYDRPLDRYLYSSWSEYAHHLYEAPAPWGPWRRMADRDYTSLDLKPDVFGGYGTTLPSKFLSPDGRTLLLQSNVCCGLPNPSVSYHYSLRRVRIEPLRPDPPHNPVEGADLARRDDAVPVAKSARQPSLEALRDGDPGTQVDDRDGEIKDQGWWGHTWPRRLKINRVDLTVGRAGRDGGWFVGQPKVQVRVDGRWVDVDGQVITPEFVPGRAGAGKSYRVRFPTVVASGVRVIGPAGGDRRWTSLAELSARHDLHLVDGGFERSSDYGPVWGFDGTAGHGFDRGGDLAHTGDRNAWVRTAEVLGAQYLTQRISVRPGSRLELSGWFRTSSVVERVLLGARWDGGESITEFAPEQPDRYIEHTVLIDVPDDVDELTLLLGYGADGGDAILQLDDVTVRELTP
ncbi:MAG TPA: DUF4185 domain-containing protein [Microlunatus sp.]|nr:DUF4185 domain-containing protein [Microlunatus sp.]